MPEYLSPGVYVEETSFRPKTIEGVSTSTAGFVGPARYGPTSGEPPLLTSFADFQRIYGGLSDLEFDGVGDRRTNYLAYAVRAFFEEGGKRCYVARVYSGKDGKATGKPSGSSLTFGARYPGAAGEMRVTVTAVPSRGINPIKSNNGEMRLPGVSQGNTLFIPEGNTPGEGFYDYVVEQGTKKLKSSGGSKTDLSTLSESETLYPFRVRLAVERPLPSPGGGDRYGSQETLGEFTLGPGTDQRLVDMLAKSDPGLDPLTTPLYIDPRGLSNPSIGAAFALDLFGSQLSSSGSSSSGSSGSGSSGSGSSGSGGSSSGSSGSSSSSSGGSGSSGGAGITTLEDFDPVRFTLGSKDNDKKGSDGKEPASFQTGDTGSLPPDAPEGFDALEDLDNVSIVAAPGYTALSTPIKRENVQGELIGHCEKMKYRIAVLDTPKDQDVGDVRDWRGKIDSTYAAMYYPWVTILDPLTRSELNVPPSGHVAGIYARNDIENGVQKAPANEVVRSAIGFEKRINKAQQDVLNPEGVNCFRFFEGRGNRLWGARMATSDNEYKYVNIRRYLAYLERSIDEGTQVFVFENNGTDLWRNVRRTISSFLTNEWRSNRLMGTSTDEAFFVKCDRSTMTQNDIDNGRLICEIGVALFRPAEFVIFRIGQKLLSDTG